MLEVRRIIKEFPGVKALSDVSVEFAPGEIHAIVGENGAGKSTLIKIICGIHQPDGGEVLFDGVPLHLHSYSDALARRINLVSQEIQVIPKSTIAENIMLDKLRKFRRPWGLDWAGVSRAAEEAMRLVELTLPANTLTGKLSAAQKQLIMIAKALSSQARVLILDEPTSSLTEHEANNLLRLLQKIRDDGVTVLYISHKLEEVLAVANRVSVLRDGHLIGTRENRDLSKTELIAMMIGRESRSEYLGTLDVDRANVVLEVRGLTEGDRFQDVNIQLRQGEILGFYGLVGSGRTELARMIIGEDPYDRGSVWIRGHLAHIRCMADSLKQYRLGYVSENRKEQGLILGTTIKENVAITLWEKLLTRIKSISIAREREVVARYMQSLDVRATGPSQIVGTLSGGNQQKVSIAKWLAAGCDILIIDEPTVGVDIGAKEYIHRLIWRLAKEEGKSIILISSDMPEIVTLARRILVFNTFRIVGEVENLNESERSYDEVSHQIGKLLA